MRAGLRAGRAVNAADLTAPSRPSRLPLPSRSAMSALPFLLRALKYPRADSFSPDDPAQFQAAVVWLENTKVRRYPIDSRGALQSPDPSIWQAALQQYLQDLECPVRLEGANQRAVLQWLLTHAG